MPTKPSTPPGPPEAGAPSVDLHAREAAVGPDAAHRERRALAWAAAAAIAIIAWIALPVAVGVLLGALLAFTFQPLYERVRARLGHGGGAIATVLGVAFALVASVAGLGWLFIAKGTALARSLVAALGSAGGLTGVLAYVAGVTERFGVSAEHLERRARSLAEAVAAHAAVAAEGVAAATASALLELFFAMLAMDFILRNWQRVSLRAQETLPLRPEYTRALFDEFRDVGRTTLLGTIVTGLVQGVFATLGYWFTGIPEPIFFGALTALASLVPAVGTLLVWVPAGVVLLLSGHVGAGIVELVWCAATVVGLSDYVIRPKLVGGEQEMPSLVTFTALFGGVEVFGLKGLILGPLLMSIAVAVLRLYGREARARRAQRASEA